MAITDLTGTTWTLNSSLTSYAGGTYTKKSYNINITTAEPIASTFGDYHDTFDRIDIGYNSGVEYNQVALWIDGYNYPTIFAYGNDTKSLPDAWLDYYTSEFTIAGGTDATNSTLIAWLDDNAEMYVPTVPDVVVSYAGDEIAALSDSGTKTLQTSGKYCTDDITISYTKPSGGGTTAVTCSLNFNQIYYVDGTGTARIITNGAPNITINCLSKSIFALWTIFPLEPGSPPPYANGTLIGTVDNGSRAMYRFTHIVQAN